MIIPEQLPPLPGDEDSRPAEEEPDAAVDPDGAERSVEALELPQRKEVRRGLAWLAEGAGLGALMHDVMGGVWLGDGHL